MLSAKDMIVIKKDKFVISYLNNCNLELTNKFIESMMLSFKDVHNFFNINYDNVEIILYTKEDFNKFIAKTTPEYGCEENIPNWLVGFSVDYKIHLVVPTEGTLEYMTKVATHEFVHYIAEQIPHTNYRVKLLDEGIACFLAHQMSDKTFQTIVQDCTNNSLHSIMDFCIYDGNEFARLNGYAYSYVIMEFLIDKFGKEKILYWLQNPDNFLNAINTLEEDFKKFLTQKINEKEN